MVSAHPESEMRSGVNRAAILTSSVGHNMLLSPALDVRYPRFIPKSAIGWRLNMRIGSSTNLLGFPKSADLTMLPPCILSFWSFEQRAPPSRSTSSLGWILPSCIPLSMAMNLHFAMCFGRWRPHSITTYHAPCIRDGMKWDAGVKPETSKFLA